MLATAQDEAPKLNESEDDRETDRDPTSPVGEGLSESFEQLERRLDEIQDLIKKREQRGDEQEVRQLREEGERLLDKLERLERAREDVEEERDEEWEELEYHVRRMEVDRLELEIERLHQELLAARQESAVRMAQIAKNVVASASYAISQAVDQLEQDEAIDFLSTLVDETTNPAIRRIIHHRLVTLLHEADRPDAVRAELRGLILSE